MLEILKLILVVIISFYILIKSADYLISSSSELGKRAGISKFVIGLTLIAIGTSLPELFTVIISIFSSSNPSAFVLGTIIGSNIANILLVFSILLIFSKKFKVRIKKFDILFLSIATISLITITLIGTINFYLSILLLLLFIYYLYMSIKKGSKKKFEEEVSEVEDASYKKKSISYLIGVFFISLIGLNLAAKGVVYSIENLGIILKIPLEFLTLTTVAFATSLPEIVVTYSAAKKSEFNLAVGNIIGSNIANVFMVIGTAGLIKTITFNPIDYFTSLIILTIATLFFITIFFIKNVDKKFGLSLFLIYFIYVFLLF